MKNLKTSTLTLIAANILASAALVACTQINKEPETEQYNAEIVNRPDFRAEYEMELSEDKIFVRSKSSGFIYEVEYNNVNEALLMDNL